jgi:hypothetical protein
MKSTSCGTSLIGQQSGRMAALLMSLSGCCARRIMDDWDALQAICLYIIYGTIIVGFGLLIAFWIMA